MAWWKWRARFSRATSLRVCSTTLCARLPGDRQNVFPRAAQGINNAGRCCDQLLHRQVYLFRFEGGGRWHVKWVTATQSSVAETCIDVPNGAQERGYLRESIPDIVRSIQHSGVRWTSTEKSTRHIIQLTDIVYGALPTLGTFENSKLILSHHFV